MSKNKNAKTPADGPVAWMHTTAAGLVYFRKKPHDKVFKLIKSMNNPVGISKPCFSSHADDVFSIHDSFPAAWIRWRKQNYPSADFLNGSLVFHKPSAQPIHA